ncbi:anthranilate phosphoribosyltransferase [Arundinibacter roseus]|uniref:Anthranilate phosphoribosyltransferase n=1 Tax=Arundinibacter roseus TaxID=2070510 RepID=A0A4R4JTK3_9BACT|nr:anthranilate phosphoribosyltransferase [Arundinibacter roseus]TDB57336.1 anthranilate phosphoribosyltransferase [Arundinibacter roseus]
MKKILSHLFDYNALSKEQAKEVLTGITKGDYNASQIASFLTIYAMRSITVAELEGFRDAMLDLCLAVDLSAYDPMDVCGTGGDGKDTFNISTLSCFVVAGAGQHVAKHGNHGVSSLCGSSTVLEYLGVKFSNDQGHLERTIEEAGVCFLHAPLFHPSMKNVAPVRRELGIKTFFNMLGPLVNPAFPKKQFVGVFNLELARLYAYLYQQTDKQFLVVHALDGYDEVSLTGPFKIITAHSEQILTPSQLGLETLRPESLSGGETVQDSAQIFLNILNNEGTSSQKQAVIANAALALSCARPQLSLSDAVEMARESLESKKALACFHKLVAA